MRTWKVGSITCGVLLIAIGVLWFLQNFIDIPFIEILLNTWPLVCIFIGAEILFLHFRNKEEKLRVHWLAIVLLVFIGLSSMTFSLGKVFLDELQFSFNSKTLELNEKINLDSAKDISVDIDNYDISIIGDDTDEVTLTGKIEGHVKSKEILEERFEKKLTLKHVGDTIFVELNNDWDDFGEFTNFNGKIFLSVPKEIAMNVTTKGGKITLSNLNGTVSADSNWGAITVSKFTGALRLKTDNGSIDIKDSLLNENSTINVENGQVSWNLLDDQTGDIKASTKYGDIQGNIGWTFKSIDNKNEEEPNSKDATAKIGDNATGSPAIMITSENGLIQIMK
ncbi:MAG: hypothetical protein K0R71_895 [Bacillales bacterium]|jgi:hypothetical protein|nr:hypothetical protein [Bacillales bacterium]